MFKRILKICASLIGALILLLAILIATNLTLVRNLPSSQDGGLDAMYIQNQKPLQIVKGQEGNDLSVNFAPEETFNAVRDNWERTGGKALLVWHKGELVYETYADGISATNRSKSYSMHKSILGLVAATMEADSLIDLDDPVSKYVDAYKKGGRENLTIRNMLQHEAGLERYSFTPPSLDTLNMLLSDKVEKTALKAELVSDELAFDYSNISYQVAGAAIRSALAQKKNQTYAQYLSERLWKPAGANDAYIWSETPEGSPRFYAGLQAAPRDWLNIGIIIAQNSGDVLPRSAVDTVLTSSATNAGYGLGVWLGSPDDGFREYGPSTAMKVPSAAPFTLADTVFFDGFGGQRVYISQDAQLVVVRIGDVRFDWDDTALPNLIVEALGLGASFSDANLTLKAANDREVNARILSRDPSCLDCKIAIFSHGAFAGDNDYDAIVEPLVSMGYHVVIPTHPDSKSHPLNESFKPQDFTSYRIEDHQLILDHFAKAKGADTEWIAVGHSFGAMIAANFAGATSDSELLSSSALGLPSHTIALSPPNAIPGVFPQSAFESLESPTLLVTGTTDLVPTMIDNWEDHLQLYKGAPKGKVTAIVFEKQNHYFNGLYGREVDRPNTQADDDLIKLLSTFLNDAPLPDGDTYRILR